MKASEFIKRYQEQHKQSGKDSGEEHRDHSLQAQARERATHPDDLHTGTAFDWEDMDAWQKELDRLDREGPTRRSKNSH